MTRADALRRILGATLVSLGAAAMWVRLLGWPTTVGRVWATIALTGIAYAVGTAGGARVSRGRGAALAVAVTLIGAIGFGAATLPPSGNQDSGPLQVFVQSLVGWLGTLLSSPVPAPLDAQTVTAVIVLSAYMTLVACLIVTSPKPAMAILPALALFIAATIFSVGSDLDPVPFGVGFAATCLAALSLWPISGKRTAIADGQAYAEITVRPSPGRGRRIAAAFVLGIGVALLAGVVQQVVSAGSEPDELNLKDKVDRHRPESQGVNPVRKISEWQTIERSARRNLFAVTVRRPPPAVWWAAQETYDGASWGSGEEYRRVDGDIPAEPSSKDRYRQKLAASFAISGLPGPWLPTYNRPTTVQGDASRYSAGGVLSAADDNAANKIYDTTSQVLALTSMQTLYDARKVELSPSAPTRALPGAFPRDLAAIADEATAGASTDYGKAQALSEYFSDNFTINETTSDVRTDYAKLREVVLLEGSGTQAQLASAYALMMRELGYSTRMATGFNARGKAGTRIVTSLDGLVWPEVQFRGLGWVPFAAAPGDVERGVPVPQEVKGVKPSATPTPTPTAATPTPTPTPTPTQEKPQEPEQRQPPWGLLLLAGPLAAYVVAVRVRARRLRGQLHRGEIPRSARPDGKPGSAAAVALSPTGKKVAGAWLWAKQASNHVGREVAVDDEGRDLPPSVVARAPEVSPPELRDLATVAEGALYSPVPPSDADVSRAWATSDRVASHARKVSGIRGRLRWWFVPISRSLPDDPLDAAEDVAESEKAGRRRLGRLTRSGR